MRILKVDDLKALIDVEGTQYNGVLSLIADGVTEDIEAYLNRKLKKEERTQKFHGGSRLYWLPAYPIDESADFTVVEDGFTLTEGDDYVVNAESGQVEFTTEVSKRIPHILSITWTGGYEVSELADLEGSDDEETVEIVTGIPSAIKMAAMIQASYLFRRRKAFGVEVSNLGSMGSLTTIEGMRGIVPEAKRILQKYRRLPSPL